MVEGKHTPGPWTLRMQRGGDWEIVSAAGEPFMGDTGYYPWQSPNIADAHLIAVAPELLSLARDYRGVIEFAIRSDLKRGDVEGANMKRLTLQYVESILAKASPPTREEGGRDDG